MNASNKRGIAIFGLLGSIVGLRFSDTHSPEIWASLAVMFVSFYSIYRYTAQMREEQGLPSMAPGIVGFLIRFVVCAVLALGLILGLCLLLALHRHA
jgi:uncharacterized membrane protein (DUF4010 family)